MKVDGTGVAGDCRKVIAEIRIASQNILWSSLVQFRNTSKYLITILVWEAKL